MPETRYEINLRANSPVRGMQLAVTLLDATGERTAGREVRFTLEGAGTLEENSAEREATRTSGRDGEALLIWWDDPLVPEGKERTATVVASTDLPDGQLRLRHLKTFYARVA